MTITAAWLREKIANLKDNQDTFIGPDEEADYAHQMALYTHALIGIEPVWRPTKREWLAGMALQGLCANVHVAMAQRDQHAIARTALDCADALLAAQKEHGK